MTYRVFILSGPRDKKMGGIGDYAANLAHELNVIGIPAVNISANNFPVPWENENYHDNLGEPEKIPFHDDYVRQLIADHLHEGERPIIHLQMCIPYCGFVVSPEFCLEYPTVVTLHEYSRISPEGQRLTQGFLQAAQRVVFSKTEEYTAVAAAVDVVERNALADKFSYQDIPSNMPFPENVQHVYAQPDNWDVAHFGMLRPGKDIDKILQLGGLFKENQFPGIIKIVGSTLWNASSSKDMADLLIEMIDGTFGNGHVLSSERQDPIALRERLVSLNETVPMAERQIPVKYYLDMPDEDVVRVLSESRVAYMPFSDGASEHSGSLPPVVGWCHGVISKRSDAITPAAFDKIMFFADTADDVMQTLKKMRDDPSILDEKHGSPERLAYIDQRRFKAVARANAGLYAGLNLK